MAFRALADGKPVSCLVTAELLFSRFGAESISEEAMRQAFQTHQTEIQAIAPGHIENGWIDEGGCVFLTTRFTRLSVTFGEGLVKQPPMLEGANTAHRMLTKIIGPNAEEVVVEWNVREETPGPEESSLSVRIVDPTIPYSVKHFFANKEWQHPTELQVILARAVCDRVAHHKNTSCVQSNCKPL